MERTVESILPDCPPLPLQRVLSSMPPASPGLATARDGAKDNCLPQGNEHPFMSIRGNSVTAILGSLAIALTAWPAVGAPPPEGARWQFQPSSDGQDKSADHIRFAPDGSLLAVWGPFPEIWLVDASTGRVHSQLSAPSPIADLCFGQDRSAVYAISSADHQGGLICWNVATGEQTSMAGYSGLLIDAVGPNSLMAVDQRGWQILSVPELSPQGADYFDEPLLPLCINANNSGIMAVEAMAGQIGQRASLVWFDTKARLSLPITPLTGRPTKACVISDQDGIVAYCEEGVGGIKLVPLNFNNGRGNDQFPASRATIKLGQSAAVGLAATPDGRFLTSAEEGGTIRIWELASRDTVLELVTGGGEITSIAVSGNPSQIAVSLAEDAGCRIVCFGLLDTFRSLASPVAPQRTADQWIERLGHPSAREAFAAASWLAENPSEYLPALRRHVGNTVITPHPEDVARWISELDAPEFRRRHSAREALLSLRDLVLPQLQAALNAGHTLGTEISLKQLIYASPTESDRSSELVLGGMRLVSALEIMGGAEAKSLLTKLKVGHPSARVRRAATNAEVTVR